MCCLRWSLLDVECVLLVAAVFGSQEFASSREPLVVTVCQVIARAEHYRGKVLKVSASVMSDGLEHTVLVDQSCPGSGLTLEFPAKPPEVPGVAALQEAIFAKQGRPGTLDKDVSAVFTGAFEWRPKESSKWALSVTRVSDVQWKFKE